MKKTTGVDNSTCYGEILVYAESLVPIQEAMGVITDDWIDSGESCHETTITLRDACIELMSIADKWQWMTDLNCTVRRDADITRADCWWFLDVDEELVARGTTPLEAIENAQAVLFGYTQ